MRNMQHYSLYMVTPRCNHWSHQVLEACISLTCYSVACLMSSCVRVLHFGGTMVSYGEETFHMPAPMAAAEATPNIPSSSFPMTPAPFPMAAAVASHPPSCLATNAARRLASNPTSCLASTSQPPSCLPSKLPSPVVAASNLEV